MTQEMLDNLIKAEGGYKYIRVEKDKGGDTFAGISKRANPDWEGWNSLHYYKPNMPLPQNVIDNLKPLVKELYRRNYWEAASLDDNCFADDSEEMVELKTLLFNVSVLSGPRIAIFALQNSLGGIEADGIMGPKTRDAMNDQRLTFNADDPNNSLESLQRGIVLTMINRFVRICLNDRSQDRFLLGWTKRMLELT